jgi:hypothetical protein
MSTTDLPLGHIGPDDPGHRDHPGNTGEDHEHDKHIVLIVLAPNDPEEKLFRFDLEILVGDAAKQAAAKFDYDESGTPSFRRSDGTVLDRNITLKAAGLKHHHEVELVDVGGGV